MKAYSIDLRTKLVESVRRASPTLRPPVGSASTVRRSRYLKQLDEKGSLIPKKSPGSPPKSFKNMTADTYRSCLSIMRSYTRVVGPTAPARVDSLCRQ